MTGDVLADMEEAPGEAAQGKRHWLKRYPPGVPADIDHTACPSLVAMFEQAVEQFHHAPAFYNFGTTLSFREIDRLSLSLAAYFQTELGLKKGDRVALMMPNLLQYPVTLWAALRAGLVVVNTNPLYTARELHHQLQDSGAKTVVILENFAHSLAECIDRTDVEHVVITRMGDLLNFPKSMLVNFVVRHVKRMVPAYHLPQARSFSDCVRRGATLPFTPAELGGEDLAFLQYTGGTTGVAKGAMLTHGNLVANVEQATCWIGGSVARGAEIVVTALPLYHVFALTANCLTFFRLGGLNVLITNPRDLKTFVAELRKFKFTAMTGVNTLFNALLRAPGFAECDFSRLNITLGGGMAVQRSVAEQWKVVTGSTLVEAYGLTETSPAVCINPLDIEAFNSSIGLPVPSTLVCIKDDDGVTQALGELGELCVKGPQVMVGYWQRPDETALTVDSEGWLHTGDIARIDETGFVFLVDRKKDMIVVSGFNVFPNEVEDVVAHHPDVVEVGAIGVSDPHSGEVVKIVVVKRDPALTEEHLMDYCRERLTGFKRPRLVEFAEELPKSNVGKILRRELRERSASKE